MTTGLFLIGRRQIYRNPADRKGQIAAFRRGTHPLPGFLDRGIGQPHNVKTRQAVGDIALSHHGASLNSCNSKGLNAADHRLISFSERFLSSYMKQPKKAILFRLYINFWITESASKHIIFYY